MLKIGEIRELIRLLDETSVAELRIETDDMKLHLKKPELQTAAVVQQPPLQSPVSNLAAVAPVVGTPAQPPVTEVAPVATSTAASEDTSLHTIKSPMVGTFYRASSPDAPAYVERGHKVEPKSVVCIVEAMKLMNEIEAEVTGEVIEVLVTNGQLVEYGQPLFKIRLS